MATLEEQAREEQRKIKEIIAMTKSESASSHNKVWELIRNAGNQLGAIEQILNWYTLREASKAFKHFIIPKLIEHEYYRYKSIVDSIASVHGIHYVISNNKEFIIKLWDVLSGNFNKYLELTDTKTVHMLLTNLPEVNYSAYEVYFNKCLNSNDKNIRLITYAHISRMRLDKVKLCALNFDQEDLEFYAPLLDCIRGYNHPTTYSLPEQNEVKAPSSEERGYYKILYPKLCALLDRLPKKSLHWNASEYLWNPRDVKFDDIVLKLFFILKSLSDKGLVKHFEQNIYSKLNSEQKTDFVNIFKSYISLDYRKEMLNYFASYEQYSYKTYKDYFTKNPLNYSEAVIVSDYLKTKKQYIKSNILAHYLKMSANDQARLKEYLLNSQEDYKREIAADLVGAAKPKVVLSVPKDLKTPIYKLPIVKPKEIAALLDGLKSFIIKNKDIEYKSQWESEPKLFGTNYWHIDDKESFLFQEETDKIIGAFKFNPDELAFILFALRCGQSPLYFRDKNTKTGLGGKYDSLIIENSLVSSHYVSMVEGYIKRKKDTNFFDAVLKRAIDAHSQIKTSDLQDKNLYNYNINAPKKEENYSSKMLRVSGELEKIIDYEMLSVKMLEDCKTILWLGYNGNPKPKPLLKFEVANLLLALFIKNVASKEEIEFFIDKGAFRLHNFFSSSWTQVSTYSWQYNRKREVNIYSDKCPNEFTVIIENLLIKFTDVEINRSLSAMPHSNALSHCTKFIGAKYFVLTLKAFQKMTLPRGYGWGQERDQIFSKILEFVIPHKTDIYESFVAQIKEHGLKDGDLVKGVLYNNDQTLLEWTDKYLDKKGFISTVMFFKAHLKDEGVSKNVQEKIALYSPIAVEDFKEGAVDVDWFWAMKNEVDDKTFKLVYDNAKYITVANFHKRAQRFNDALTGKLTAEECLAKIKETRNKEFILYYSLVPLKDDKELHYRYEIVQKFLLESKQFGAQRQASEKKACEIALENMARVAGYDDADRFVWFMESKEAGRIAPYFESKIVADAEVYLQITDKFKCKVVVSKGGKELSSIPTKLKVDPYVVAMKAEVSALNKQSSRVVKSLENAMERESRFSLEELKTIAANPVIKQILKSLFFIAEKRTVLFDGEGFIDFATQKTMKADNAFIAHPHDLFSNNSWEAVQRYLLQNKIRQPFKQAFRELYPKTDDETEAMETNRYYGHQVNVNKAIAVGKNRGWHSGEDIGLQKVFYKEGIVAVFWGVGFRVFFFR